MKNNWLIALFLFSFSTALAQKDDHSIFAVKYSPTQLAMGEFHFTFEHRIARQSSIEVGLGPTISEIGIPQLLYNGILNNNSGVTHKSAMGVFTSVAYRYYPLVNYATAPRGLYVGPELKYRLYTTQFIDNAYGLGSRNGSVNQFMFKFDTGYQFWFGQTFTLDCFLGLGIGSTRHTAYYATQEYIDEANGWSNPKWASRTNSRIHFIGNIGFRIGVGGPRKFMQE
jgi:hypothetical protein